MHAASLWLPPLLVTAGLATIGWLLRSAVGSIVGRIEDLEASFSRIAAELTSEHRLQERRLNDLSTRLVRIETWRDYHTHGHHQNKP